MKTSQKLILVGSAMLTSMSVSAHSGHDHSHWSSDLLHAMFYLSLAAAAGALAFATKKYANKKKAAGDNL